MNTLLPYTWQTSQLDEALTILMDRSGLSSDHPAVIEAPPDPRDETALHRFVETLAEWHGFEAEPIATSYADIEATLCAMAPALVRLPVAGEYRFLMLVRGGRRLHVFGPDQAIHRLDPARVRTALCTALEAPVVAELDQLVEDAGLTASDRVRTTLLRERLGSKQIAGLWLLRLPPSAPFLKQLRQTGLIRRLGQLLAAHALQYVLWILAWWTIGLAALQGRFDSGWLLAWTLLLITLVPLRLLVTWLQGYTSIHAGGLLKRRLLFGALHLPIETIRRQGIGQLLGRVIESNTVESLALSGGFLGFVAVIELVMAACVLALGAGGVLHTLMLVSWLVITAFIAWHAYQRQATWTGNRLTLTHRLVERMIGHRTRLAQQARARWHTGEDREAADYLTTSRAMDHTTTLLLALVPRGWLVVGFAALAPGFVAGHETAGLAVGLGGMLLAYQAFQRLSLGLSHLHEAAIAWKHMHPFFQAAATNAVQALPNVSFSSPGHAPIHGETVLEAHDLTFRYTSSNQPVLKGINLAVQANDRLLLEGPSGGGKSTLASLLTGLRSPESGLMLLRGLDRHTLGRTAWRKQIASAPQFHENHVLTGTFAFNLLMGRRWPPTQEDLNEAEQLCRDLGLGDLLDRMPAGLMQMVGETGWQLSHGERSRLFLARALLQKADMVILDESFGALDPANRTKAMACTLEQAPTLMVIAHP